MSLTKVSFSMIQNAPVNVADFGAVGDGVTNDTAAIQAAFNASTNVYFGGSDKSYLINNELILQSGTTAFGAKPTITQTANLKPIFNIDTKDNITVTGIKFVGKGTDFVNNDANPYATAIYTNTGSSNLYFANNEFNNFGYAGVRLKAATNIQVIDNVLVGPGSPILTPITSGACYGILTDYDCTEIVISGNIISEYAQGLRIETNTNVVIANNLIRNIIGQHGMYIGSDMQNITVSGNTIVGVSLIGVKVQAQATASGNNKNIAITGNTIFDTGGDGIVVLHATGSGPQAIRNQNITITGNDIADATAYGIVVQNTDICTIGNNAINVCGGSGVIISASNFLDISNNTIIGTQLSGLRDQSPCTNVCISDNIFHNCAIANTGGDNSGIFIQDGTGLEISSNNITDASGGMENGIFVAGGSQPTQSIYNNQVFNSSAKAIRFASTSTAMAMYKNNVLIGTTGASVNNPATPSVASASSISLLTAHDVTTVTGTTTITDISAEGHTGHIVTLIFDGALTVTDGSNLKLAGNFVTTADDTLTLACNGTNWYEVARSVN